jgi:hypothetical protein
MERPPLQQINIYRQTRVPTERDLSINKLIDAAIAPARDATRAASVVDGVLPAEIAKLVGDTSFSKGMLTLRVTNAAALHVVAAWLRGGGEVFIRTKLPKAKRARAQLG